jgi:pimeloyl-ACP methyl ester carboxylesterase
MAHPLVLIHGMSASARCWDPVLPFLQDRREVHVVTLPGHRGGAPITDPQHLSTSGYVDAVEAELDRLGLPRADLVGNSLGGWVALQLAGRGRARAVVCLAPAGGWRVGSAYDLYLTTQFSIAYRACARLLTPRGARFTHHPRVKRALLRSMVARPDLISDRQLDDIVADIAGCEALPLSVERSAGRDVGSVPRSPCPVLIAWSEHDRILVSRANRRRLQAQVGAPWVTRLPGVGHVPMSDDPFLVADTILRFTTGVTEPA